MARPGPRSLADDGEAAAGGHRLPDVPGHAHEPAPPPVDQQHHGGQARTASTTRTEPAILRGFPMPGDAPAAKQAIRAPLG
jgi:hypothetical protein